MAPWARVLPDASNLESGWCPQNDRGERTARTSVHKSTVIRFTYNYSRQNHARPS
jgi:hypothetical protein